MKAFLEEYFLHIIIIILIILLLWSLVSYTMPTKETCLSLGYPDSKVILYLDGIRTYCLNHLEAIEIELPR